VQTLRFIGVLELGGWGSPEVSPKVFGFGLRGGLENGWVALVWGIAVITNFTVAFIDGAIAAKRRYPINKIAARAAHFTTGRDDGAQI